MAKPTTTLFMLMSVDGKISTGNTDEMDFDQDLPRIKGVREGLSQYYEIEKTTDLHFLITGTVMAKGCSSLDINHRADEPTQVPANCIIVDNSHLKKSGVEYLLKKFNSVTVVTKNPSHPAISMSVEGLKMVSYTDEIDFVNLFEKLKEEYGIDALTIQSGGTLNSILLRDGLIDRISIVIAPALIGGTDTPSLINGKSLSSMQELSGIKALELVEVKQLDNSYVHLRYNVINDTIVE